LLLAALKASFCSLSKSSPAAARCWIFSARALLAAVSGGLPSARTEVREALAELGYGTDEIRRALDGLPPEGTVEDLLRGALHELAATR